MEPSATRSQRSRRPPFDFVITVPEERMRIMDGVAGNREKDLNRRVDEILSVSRVVQARPITITKGEKLPNNDLSCISGDELSKFKEADDLITNVT